MKIIAGRLRGQMRLSNNQPDGFCTTTSLEWFEDQIGERMERRVDIQV